MSKLGYGNTIIHNLKIKELNNFGNRATYSQRSITTVLTAPSLVTVVCPQVVPKATLKLLESLQVAVHVPEVGQLQVEFQLTDEGVNSQLSPFKLFKTVMAPPLTVLVLRALPVIAMVPEVVAVISSKATASGPVKRRLVPESENVKVLAPVLTRVCPPEGEFTPKTAPRRPLIPILGIRVTESPLAGIVQVAFPVPANVKVTAPEIVPPAAVLHPVRFFNF